MRDRLLLSCAVGVMILAWASAFPVIRFALRGIEPMPLAAVRFATAAVPALAWLCWRRPTRPTAAEVGRIMLCGLFGIAFYNAALNTGEQTVAAGAASFIINVAPLLTALLAAVVLGDRPALAFWGSSLVSLAGVGLIARAQPGGLALGAGASLILGAAACYACYALLQRPLVAVHGALTSTAYTLLAGALLLSPWLASGIRQADAFRAGGGWLAVVELGLIPSILGFGTWSHVSGRLGPARAANFLYLVPPTASALAFLISGERPGLEVAAGGTLAIGGVVLANMLRGGGGARAGSGTFGAPTDRRTARRAG
jgi:drug/metabolite transporter (DMT)-like permease